MCCFVVVAGCAKRLQVTPIISASLLSWLDMVDNPTFHALTVVHAIRVHTPRMRSQIWIANLDLPLVSIATVSC